jgi:hypothetical protein
MLICQLILLFVFSIPFPIKYFPYTRFLLKNGVNIIYLSECLQSYNKYTMI